MNLLSDLLTYLAGKLDLTTGTNAFYNEDDQEPAKCLLIQEEPTRIGVPAQINAAVHLVKIVARDSTNALAKTLADDAWRWLLTSDSLYDTKPEKVDTTGFVNLGSEKFVYVWLYGVPTWLKADDKGRKYFSFYAQITTAKF